MSNALPDDPKPQLLQNALAEEAKQRIHKLIEGVSRYVETPHQRELLEPPCVWRRGNARMLDYGSLHPNSGQDRPIVLWVPSLINRYYILDLDKERSFLRYLSQHGVHPLVIDWGNPGPTEQDWDCGHYVTNIVLEAIVWIHAISRQPVTLAGYCMGGVLALAAALLTPDRVSKLALFATPWNFDCETFRPFKLTDELCHTMELSLKEQSFISAAHVQSLFYLTEPWLFEQKFRRFADMPDRSRTSREFLTLEHWVNDGVSMTSSIAVECLIGWIQHNKLMKNDWEINGTKINSEHWRGDTWITIPKKDHIVPNACAVPLAQKMPQAIISMPSAGHVGMMIGKNAARDIWRPFVQWLKK